MWAFDLRIFSTGTAAAVIAATALAAFYVLLITTFVKSRSVRLIGGVGKPTASGDAQLPKSKSPADSRPDGCEDSERTTRRDKVPDKVPGKVAEGP